MGYGSTLNLPHSSTPPLYHLYSTSSPPTPNLRLNPPITKPWVHVTSSQSFSNMRIDLLLDIVVTFATSHWLRSPLKTETNLKKNVGRQENTVARKEGRLHSQSTRKKSRRKNPDQILKQTKEGKHSSNYTYFALPTQTTEWTSLHHKSMFRSRYVILKHTYRLDVMHAGGTNQTTSTQTLLTPNALALAPNHHHPTYIHFPRQQSTQLAHTKPRNVQ